MRPQRGFLDRLDAVDWNAVVTWALCFGLVAYLGIEGGGYDVLVHDQVGIAIWWVLLIGVVVGALPRVAPSPLALAALGLFAAFVCWTALSLIWTESSERTMVDLARVLTFLGIFTLVLSVKAAREPRRLVCAVAAAIALVAMLGLLSRLHPAWFPSADETGRLLEDSRERLSYPLNYWNALGAMTAMGVPLLLWIAAGARTALVRFLAAAALPAMALTIFFTLSRGGIGAAVLATAIFIAFSDDRLPKLLTAGVAAVGAAILVALAVGREALRHGLTNSTAHHQGDEMLLIGALVCIGVGLLQLAISAYLGGERRPAWTVPSRRFSLSVLAAGALVLVVLAAAVDAPGRLSSAYDEFREGGGAGQGTSRLNSFAGESRYALWRSAVDENATAPLTGTGSGTFEYWWDRDAAGTEAVLDAHSLYLQTLGELGIVGLALLVAFLVAVLGFGAREVLSAGGGLRAPLAAALAACFAFFLSAAVDWTWQIPALPAAALLLAATLVAVRPPWDSIEPWLRWLPTRIAIALFALVAIVVIAIPLASTSLVRESESEVRAGELSTALEDARSAQRVEPWAATPRLQQALVLELQGRLDAAAAAAVAATERESTNWRTFLVLSRIEAERGNADASIAAYRKARSLNPLSPLFQR